MKKVLRIQEYSLGDIITTIYVRKFFGGWKIKHKYLMSYTSMRTIGIRESSSRCSVAKFYGDIIGYCHLYKSLI